MYHVLYNPQAGNKTGEISARKLLEYYKEEELSFEDITRINAADYVQTLPPEDVVIICGGDGTVHHFANDTYGKLEGRTVLYYASGSGNDFLTDIGFTKGDGVVRIDPFLQDLPKVECMGQTYRFVNNMAFGIDGYCCEEGDRIRATSDKPINYTTIAIKGLLGKFHPVNAKVTVDGETREYRKVWMVPTMKGSHFGGGMIPTPDQDRMDPERKVSVLVFHGLGPLRTLILFPSIFTGKHVKFKKNVHIVTGKEVYVEFDRPTAAQVDGETITNVTSYRVTVE
ncbi:MAG: diacylglycerol kinase family protein [Lachnospiraceae bacterium]|nr:diacylglycerol kinase family protein [Lachnospiraceae bacterium]